jgi:hypothetical protein
MIRAATPKEIQDAFAAEFIRLGRPMTDAEAKPGADDGK